MMLISNKSLISIVMPAYNVGEYISRSIQSVLNQTYDAFELIIVDDGSTDNTFSIIDELSFLDKRIRVIRQSNSGVSVARNVGISIAKGEYVAFLDGDDIWMSTHLEKAIDFFQKYPDIYWYSSSFQYFWNELPVSDFSTGLDSQIRVSHYFSEKIKRWDTTWTSAVVVRKTCLNNNLFPSGIQNGEDEIAWATIAAKYPFYGKYDGCTVYYRQRTGSLSCNFKESPRTKCKALLDLASHYAMLSHTHKLDRLSLISLRSYVIYAWEQAIICYDRELTRQYIQKTSCLQSKLLMLYLKVYHNFPVFPSFFWSISFKLMRKFILK